jgi:ribosomal protein S18 acetylase RimI-like enzyme
MAEILTLSAGETKPLFPQLAAVYQAAFDAAPYYETLGDFLTFEGRLPFHVRWKGFRCVVARRAPGESIIGFAYGYTSQVDTWWHAQVITRLSPWQKSEWLSDCFEFVELGVTPAFQGQGIGGSLHDALLSGLQHRTAVLSTPQQQTNALHLYRKRGWIDLLQDFHFAGVAMAYRIMGKKLN